MLVKNYVSKLVLIFFLQVTVGFGCRSTIGQVSSDTADPGAGNSSSFVDRMPADTSNLAYEGLAVHPIRQFYAAREERMFWTANWKSTPQADSLVHFIANIRYFGLRPDNYSAKEIGALTKALNSPDNIFRYEALLTGAYISLLQNIWLGQTDTTSSRTDSVAVSVLRDASMRGGIVKSLLAKEPSGALYRNLKDALKLYIDSLAQDQRDAVLSGVSTTTRLQTIEVNLERLRLDRNPFRNRYILVNIPEYMLYVIENDSVILESKVIVGNFENQTPELSSKIECFITYPYWHVPRKIATKEYLPLIQADTTFLSRNNFDVLDRKGKILRADSLDWKKYNENYFPVRLRQREGPENALGVIKFEFDNPYAVFVHDTNSKRLFRNELRALSHGCIRMEKAIELAHYLVTGDLTKKSKVVERYLTEKSRHSIELKQPMPIHIRYYTCNSQNGELRFFPDIYEKDGKIAAELLGESTRDSNR